MGWPICARIQEPSDSYSTVIFYLASPQNQVISSPTVSLLTPTQTLSSSCFLHFLFCVWKVPCHLLGSLVALFYSLPDNNQVWHQEVTTSPSLSRVGHSTIDIPKLAFSQYIPVVKAVALWPLGIKHMLESLTLPSHTLMEPQDSWGQPGLWCEMTYFVNDKERLLDNVLLNPTSRRINRFIILAPLEVEEGTKELQCTFFH